MGRYNLHRVQCFMMDFGSQHHIYESNGCHSVILERLKQNLHNSKMATPKIVILWFWPYLNLFMKFLGDLKG